MPIPYTIQFRIIKIIIIKQRSYSVYCSILIPQRQVILKMDMQEFRINSVS